MKTSVHTFSFCRSHLSSEGFDFGPFWWGKKINKNDTPNLTVKIHTGYTQLATPTDILCMPLLTYSIFLFDFIYVAPCSLKGHSWEVNADTLLWLYLTLPLLYNDINGAIKWVAPIHREGGASGVHKTHRTPTERERERELQAGRSIILNGNSFHSPQ